MKVQWIPVKIKERLQKLDSSDYTNLECWQFVEAFNKAQLEWVRSALDPRNSKNEGAESNLKRTNDLSILLTQSTLMGVNKNEFFESQVLPEDYLQYRRLAVYAVKETCKNQKMVCDLREEANVDELLGDHNTKPSFEWRETFSTLIGGKLRVYKDEFNVEKTELVYYRKPINISLSNCPDITGQLGTNIDPELPDDVVELIIDDAAAILAGDIESINQVQILNNRSEKNK
jgi:hypothetical protein